MMGGGGGGGGKGGCYPELKKWHLVSNSLFPGLRTPEK